MYRLLVVFSLLLLFSCSEVTDPNKSFNAKYSMEVQNILNSRPASQKISDQDLQRKRSFGAITQDDVINESIDSNIQYYPYFDIRKFGQKTPKVHLPNMEVYDKTRFQNPSNQTPPDIFEVTYDNRQYRPFKYQGARFDAIAIPPTDIYGVETSMTNKEYLLAGNNSVQNSIENMKSNRESFDTQNSAILIAEQKNIRHEKKTIKIFGKHVLEESGLE
ncbi:MAG: hypothetical protein ISQ34_03950 [Rickettsiales bacterium]|nr:hypothetical protein [Rickettsiales bacterium]